MGNALAKLTKPKDCDGGYVRAIDENKSFSSNYNRDKIAQLIEDRRLAPFYPDSSGKEAKSAKRKKMSLGVFKRLQKAEKRDTSIDPGWLTSDMVDCPICFSKHPRNINRTWCCGQPICTTCFVHLRMPQSRSISCPYCNAAPFAIMYKSPRELAAQQAKTSEKSCTIKSQSCTIKSQSVHCERKTKEPSNDFCYLRTQSMRCDSTATMSNRTRSSRIATHDNPYRPPMCESRPSHRSYYCRYSLH